MDVRVGLWRNLSDEELMLLNCGVGEDSWESLGLQGDPTSPFWRRSALGFLWKEWYESWNSSTLATSCEELTHWKRLWCWEGLGARGEVDDRGWDGWMASLTWWTWVWVNSGSWLWTGRPDVLWFMESRTWLSDWFDLIWPHPRSWLALLRSHLRQTKTSLVFRLMVRAQGWRHTIAIDLFFPTVKKVKKFQMCCLHTCWWTVRWLLKCSLFDQFWQSALETTGEALTVSAMDHRGRSAARGV